MGLIKFKTLGISLNKNNCYLRYDGFVSDLEEHTRKVLLEFDVDPKVAEEGYKELLSYHSDLSLHDGRLLCTSNKDETIYNYVIFFKNTNNRLLNTFNKGHEETHALHCMDELHLLEKKLRNSHIPIGLSDFYNYKECSEQDQELVANIGGFYGLQRKKFDMSYVFSHEFSPSITKYRPDLQPAVIAYKKALKLGKKV